MDKMQVNAFLSSDKGVLGCPICGRKPVIVAIDKEEVGGSLYVINCPQCGIIARTNRMFDDHSVKILRRIRRAWNHQAHLFGWLLRHSGLDDEKQKELRRIVLIKLRSHY